MVGMLMWEAIIRGDGKRDVYSPLPHLQLSISGALTPAAKEIVGCDLLGGAAEKFKEVGN